MGKLHIYNASAGSGKTFSLVREYLTMLFLSPRTDAYRSILAVTFTNKAAWEMKRRILSVLEDLSCGKDAGGMGVYIAQKTGVSSQQIQRKAGEILESIFNDYSAFSVSTIDSFTTRLVRSFSRELNLPVGFNIVVDADDILQQAVDMLLMRAGTDDKLSDMLVDFVMRNVDQGSGWDISSILFSGGKLIQNQAGNEALEKLGEKKVEDYLELGRRLSRYKASVEKEISALGIEACDIIYNKLGSDKILAGGSNGVASFFRKARDGRVLDLDGNSAAVEKFLAGKYSSSTVTAEQKIAIGNHYENLCRILENILDILEKKKKVYGYADMVLGPLSRMGVAGEIESEMKEIKQRGSVMLLYEFNNIISRHLRREPVPFIYEKIGERYKHYFIDEFQDTSRMQWDNLRELVYNQLAQDGQAVVVGDAKQAIYRWRGGDTEQFVTLYEEGGGLPSEQYEIQNLGTNYRSRSTIVDFTNEFFTLAASMAGSEAFQQVYEQGNRQQAADSRKGFVSIQNIEGRTAEARLEPMLQGTLGEIKRVMEKDGFPYRDIAVLYRSNRDGSVLAQYLSENGIPVVSSESLMIASAEAVRIVAALLQFINYPDDLQVRATVLDFLEREKKMGQNEADDLKTAGISGSANGFFGVLSRITAGKFIREEISKLPLYESVEYIADAFSLWGRGQDAYLTAFLDMVADFVKDESASSVAFLEHWEMKKSTASIPASDTGNAVTLMTVHKAKGLEFPVVVVPFASWKISDREDIWTDVPQEDVLEGLPVACVPLSGVKKYGLDEVYAPYEARILLDNLNLLYVALTRAGHQLHVLTSLDVPGRTVAGFFGTFLGNTDIRNEDDPEGIYLYSAGRRGNDCPKEDKAARAFSVKDMGGSPWRDRLRVSLEWKKIWAVPVMRAVEQGNVIHAVLSAVENTSQIEVAVSRGVLSGLFPRDRSDEIAKAARAVAGHPELREYFDGQWEAQTEREIVTASGKLLRPDRICLRGKRAVVIDYKTGSPDPAHKSQVEEYSRVLSDMGYEIEKRLLVYLKEENIEIIPC